MSIVFTRTTEIIDTFRKLVHSAKYRLADTLVDAAFTPKIWGRTHTPRKTQRFNQIYNHGTVKPGRNLNYNCCVGIVVTLRKEMLVKIFICYSIFHFPGSAFRRSVHVLLFCSHPFLCNIPSFSAPAIFVCQISVSWYFLDSHGFPVCIFNILNNCQWYW